MPSFEVRRGGFGSGENFNWSFSRGSTVGFENVCTEVSDMSLKFGRFLTGWKDFSVEPYSIGLVIDEGVELAVDGSTFFVGLEGRVGGIFPLFDVGLELIIVSSAP